MTPGTRLGPYEVVAPIGFGGMGEVYRARDSRLDRTVAIKVLPADLSADATARARFEREARAVAALDHPHICSIFDVGDADGTLYLVMPLLDGQTLAARLEKGPLPLDQAMKIAAEIADALDKAHRHGVVHRDLKPGNIMLTKPGAKLLDFGLAKLTAPPAPISMSGMVRMATTSPGTGQGVILGTVQYMSPEQVEGKEADARSDIWALGAVIYEMTTGRRPFAGDTPASVIGAILKDAPPPVTERQPLAPAILNHIVERCLEKDPEDRWQNAGDIADVMAWAMSSQAPPPAAGSHGSRWERIAWLALTAILVAALGYLAVWRRPAEPQRDVVRLSVNPPTGTVFMPHIGATVPTPQFSIAPDGRAIAMVAAAPGHRPSLWLRSLEDTEARSLQGTDDAQEPIFWSPDSTWIGFADPRGNLKKVAVSGSVVQTIATGVPDARGASWGAGDTILFGTGYGPVNRVSAAGGTPAAVTQLDRSRQEGSHRWPQYLPDGRHFLFTVRSGLQDQRGVYIGSIDDGTRRRLLAADADAYYLATGHILFLDGNTLIAQAFDASALTWSGAPVPVATRVGRSSRGNGAFSVSTGGTLVFAPAMLQPGRLAWFDRNGSPFGTVGIDGDHDYSDFRLSVDGTRLVASVVDAQLSLPDIWMFDLVRGGNSRMTFGPALNAAAVWSPGGDRIAFRTNRKGLTELYQKSAIASGDDLPLLLEDAARDSAVASSNVTPSDWSADGQYLAFASGAPSDVWLLPVAAASQPTRFVQAPGDQMHANFSPDGSLMAYTSNESGRFEVYVETLPVSQRKWPISTSGGYEPRWRADGREIYYLSEDRRLMAVPVTSGPSPFGVPRPLFQTQVHPGVSLLRTHYVPSRDGSRFLLHVRGADLAPAALTVVLNATSVLKP